MKLINPTVEIIKPEDYSVVNMFKHIERCGRVCYQSYDKVDETSYLKFIQMIQNRGHLSVFEHGTVYLKIPSTEVNLIKYPGRADSLITNKYTKHRYNLEDGIYYVTTNFRVIKENGFEDLMQYICEPTESHYKRTTVKFILPIGISREFCRHRVFSFSEQSTRYCNFSLDKFNNEITFIIPTWVKDINSEKYSIFFEQLRESEITYFGLIDMGFKPQEARDVLPLSTKSELIMTGFDEDWEQFLRLRNHSSAHPDAQYLANMLENLMFND